MIVLSLFIISLQYQENNEERYYIYLTSMFELLDTIFKYLVELFLNIHEN